jgi:catechol 2,3-dioxygenase-like lactoylglutathione lyase family enzyme
MANTDLPPLTRGLSELVLVVRDVQAAARFYREVVGLIPARTADLSGDAWAWFWAGRPEASARLALRRGPLLFEEHSPHPPGRRWGPVHFAFEVARAELPAAVQRVRAAGIEVYGPQRLEWMKADSWYFFDPDGNELEWWSPDPA